MHVCVGRGSIVNAMLVNTSRWSLPNIWIAKVDPMILDQQEFEYRVLYDGTTQFVPIIIKVIHSQLDLEDLHTTESSSVPSFCVHVME